MPKHRRDSDLNNKPYDQSAPPAEKAKDFDRQYNANRKYTNSPELDAKRKRDGK